MARAKTTPRVSLRFIDELIARHLELDRQLSELQAEKARLDGQLRSALDLSPEKRAETEAGSAMLVESDVVTYDLDVLKERLSPGLLESLTRRTVDKTRVEAAIALGLLAPEIADEARRLQKRNPQLRVAPR